MAQRESRKLPLLRFTLNSEISCLACDIYTPLGDSNHGTSALIE